MKQFETVQEKKTDSVSVNESTVGTLFCDNASAMYSGYCINLCRTAELNKTVGTVIHILQISNTKIKVFSQVCTMKNEMIWQANEIESLINDSVYDSGAYVQPFNIAKPGQETPSENETPHGLLPP
jgi:hypothetical protein